MKNPENIPQEPADELSPTLDRLRRDQVFEVPENYFGQLEQDIHTRIAGQKRGGRNRVQWWVAVVAAAAMLGAVAFMFTWLYPGGEQADYSELAMVLQDKEAIYQYLLENGNVSEDNLYELSSPDELDQVMILPEDTIFPVQDSSGVTAGLSREIVMDSTISKDDILNYLLDEGVEVNPFE